MINTDSRIFFNFSYFALRLLGKGLYSNHWTAISELVANGLDANADNVKLYINMKDKEHSEIEIFDNGRGMNYKDLAEKYVLIGKDKREDEDVDEETKKQFMGRKGIGKLAALYLSYRYYLISKTNKEETAWCLDASNVKDSDIPHLDRKQIDEISIEARDEWNKFKTGTMVKLTNVDLTNFGEKTLAAFKARLADFYLLDELKGKIEIAVLMGNEDRIIFEEVKKSIAFKNICAFYNNTNIDFSNKIGKTVYVSSPIDSIKMKPRPVEILDPHSFEVKGKKAFLKPNGELTKDKLEYEMKGWIGLHTSIQKEDAHLNDSEYLKNKAYRPNQLRLYVRRKLAVENFLDYMKNTQVFSNYVEGEISFDILDDNELSDIATSNRQGFVEDDERILLLISILRPIITSLIRSRIALGNQVRNEEEDYHRRVKEEEERKRKEAEDARLLAERERERLEKAKQDAEIAKVIAEQERDEAQIAKKQAEEQISELDNALKNVSDNLGSEKRRNFFLFDALSSDQFEYSKKLHMVKINVGTIEKVITKLVMKIQRNIFNREDIWESLKTISYCTGRINAVLQYGAVAQFDTKEESTTGDLFQYICEYVENVLVIYTNIKIQVLLEDNIQYIRKFSMQDIAVVLENVVSNSLKHNSNILNIHMYKTRDKYAVDFIDNGMGLDKITNCEELFEFGKSFTAGGTGVGLFHIREIINEMGGEVKINEETKMGFELNVRFDI